MPNEIPEWMILDSFRYAVGRMSYQVEITTAWLIANWNTLSFRLQEMIKKELDEELKRRNLMKSLNEMLKQENEAESIFRWVRLWVEINNPK